MGEMGEVVERTIVTEGVCELVDGERFCCAGGVRTGATDFARLRRCRMRGQERERLLLIPLSTSRKMHAM
jgi:hypothetical protein